MKNFKSAILLSALTLFCLPSEGKTVKSGVWSLDFDTHTGAVSLARRGETVINRSVANWGLESDTVSMTDCRKLKVSGVKGAAHPAFNFEGQTPDGSKVTLTFTLLDDDSFSVGLTLAGRRALEGVDFITPVNTTAPVKMDWADMRQLSVPYDNDAWVRYQLTSAGDKARESYEVGALLDVATRAGIIAGSIDHDTWKSAVRYATTAPATLDELTLVSGATSELTRDVRRHGVLKGEKVSSARFFVTLTDDWRDGLEEYADLCAQIAPNQTKGGVKPFGWNSWGDLQTKINYKNATEVADFIKADLMPSFSDSEGSAIVNLDAFWDFGFREEDHKKFTEHCRSNGQKAGIYFCPFTDWGKNPDATVSEAPEYKMGDLYLRSKGEPIVFDGAPALDPTHPGTKARVAAHLEKFKNWGYEYVKIDFMAHGAYESDHHYNPAVTTGTQAFSEGLQFIDSVADGTLWINLSIAPLFPASYAQSRRIGCDAWSNIGSTEYTLNALTYGWWLDHLYHYNDADHIVFKDVTEGENRARLTSSAITGVYFLGDNMSETGDSITKERLRNFAVNDRINNMARRTKSFRPVRPGEGESASDIFEGRDKNTVWVAIFNYGENEKSAGFTMEELKLSPDRVKSITELWSGESMAPAGKVSAVIPPKDVKLFEIEIK
ncbi:MAG: alpha-galactosidase [Muribaculaceae bacterium]|nr:alpha-galactosidase [Muribaculaceae bacterium]